MNTSDIQTRTITQETLQDLTEIMACVESLPPEVRLKIQYLIEGAKLVSTPEGENHGGAA